MHKVWEACLGARLEYMTAEQSHARVGEGANARVHCGWGGGGGGGEDAMVPGCLGTANGCPLWGSWRRLLTEEVVAHLVTEGSRGGHLGWAGMQCMCKAVC